MNKFNHFTMEGRRYNDYAEGFGNVLERGGVYDSRARNLDGVATIGTAVSINQIPGTFGTSFQTVIFKPLSGIFDKHKYLQLRCMQITIELSSVDDPLEPIVRNFANHICGGASATLFTNVKTSTTWQIQNVQAKCEIIALDSGLNECYMKLLEEGKKFDT